MSEIVVAKCKIMWKITNFTSVAKGRFREKQLVRSSDFIVSLGDNRLTKWYFNFYPNKNEHCGFFLCRREFEEMFENFEVQLKMEALNHEMKTVGKVSLKRPSTDFFPKGWGWNDFLKVQDILTTANVYLDKNTLTLMIDMEFYEAGTPVEIRPPDLSTKLTEKFFNSKDFSDITIISADEKEYPAHSCIIAARSDVFEKMLTTEMIEKETNRIVVEDVDGETMLELMRYIYTNEVHNLGQHAPQLIYAAEKYNLPDLKSMCASKLIEGISKKNVFDTFVLATRFDEQKLLSKCKAFINAKFSTLKKSDEWKKLDHEMMVAIVEHAKGESANLIILVDTLSPALN